MSVLDGPPHKLNQIVSHPFSIVKHPWEYLLEINCKYISIYFLFNIALIYHTDREKEEDR